MATQAIVLPQCTSRTTVKKNRHLRSSRPSLPSAGSSTTGPDPDPNPQQYSTVTSTSSRFLRRCSSVPSSAEDPTTAILGRPLVQVKSSTLAPPSASQKEDPQILPLPKLTSSASLRWSPMRKGIRRLKVSRITTSRRSIGRNTRERTITFTGSNCAQGQHLPSDSTRFGIPALHGGESDVLLNSNLSQKYQPKLFEDIMGHEITIKAISKAAEKKKIARLYLFHGPSGTGKTSTGRILAMALNCESTSHTKPCWRCRGCSRSLYVMELCSGSRIAGLERIKTLLQSTAFSQAIPGFKVLIIEECQSFNAEAWEELLGIAEREHGSRVVFVLITTDANMVPRNISSRCQKFCFPKLKDEEITLKLAKIVACEGIRIEKEALKLITAKAEGSLKEAENLLDQLALLGSMITSSMVQQLVGLVPQSKLLDLLATVISGDTIKTVRCTRELIITGVEPQTLVSQLASLITDILSGAVVADLSLPTGSSKDEGLLRSRSQLKNTQSERLCSALKILVETEKQLRSSPDQNSRILAALLEITSEDVCNRISSSIVLPRNITSFPGGKPNAASEVDAHGQRLSGSRSNAQHHFVSRTYEQPDMHRTEPTTTVKSIDPTQRSRGKEVEKKPNLAQMSGMEEIWQNMLASIESGSIKDFLCQQVKLASLTVSSGGVIVHLMFERQEDKMAAQISEGSISEALRNVTGCPVTVNMSLEPVDLVSTNSLSMNLAHSKQQQRIPPLAEFFYRRNFEAAMHHTTGRESSPLLENTRPVKFKDRTRNQGIPRCPPEEKEANTTWPEQISPFVGLLSQKNQFETSANPERDVLTVEQTSTDKTHFMAANKPKHRWLSLSSIPQSDASVEPYSQDILFEKANKERERETRKYHKFPKGFLKATDDHDLHHRANHQKWNSSWSCTEVFCRRKTTGRNNEETIPART